jgi:hypothetical protein
LKVAVIVARIPFTVSAIVPSKSKNIALKFCIVLYFDVNNKSKEFFGIIQDFFDAIE